MFYRIGNRTCPRWYTLLSRRQGSAFNALNVYTFITTLSFRHGSTNWIKHLNKKSLRNKHFNNTDVRNFEAQREFHLTCELDVSGRRPSARGLSLEGVEVRRAAVSGAGAGATPEGTASTAAD